MTNHGAVHRGALSMNIWSCPGTQRVKSMSNSRTVLFTDIHGCLDELSDLLDMIKPTRDDTLLGFSDIVDKGPSPAETVQFVRKLSETIPTTLVFGNHEYKLHRFKNKYDVDRSKAMKMKRSDELEDTVLKLNEDDWKWLKTAKSWAKIPGRESIIVHAGIQHAVKTLPEQNVFSLSKDEIGSMSHLWFTRYVNPAGFMVTFGSEKTDDCFWAETYDGRFGHVYFGHQPFFKDEPVKYPHATGFDLGCVNGGKLAAIVIDDDQINCVSVKSKREYSSPYKDRFYEEKL